MAEKARDKHFPLIRSKPASPQDSAKILELGGLTKQILELMELADCKGFEVERALIRNHWRLTAPNRKLARTATGSAAFSVAEAVRHLERQPNWGSFQKSD